MKNQLKGLIARTKLIAGALLLVVAGVSHASGTQVGGGATLPSIGYVGFNAAYMNQVSGSNVAPNSLFGVYSTMSGNTVSYCSTGSGAGKNTLAGIVNNNVQNNCIPTTTLYGFGAPAVGRTDLTQPNFVASDVPLSDLDYSNYKSIHTATNANPTEFPAVASAIAIAFNLVDSTGDQVTSSEVNFTDGQLCLIFSGQITMWNDARLSIPPNSAFTLPPGHSIPSVPINVQYDSNGSGTTFSFSNHLSAACNTTANPLETSQTFFPAPSFNGPVPYTYVVKNYFNFVNNPAVNDGLPNGDGLTKPKWTGSPGAQAVANGIRDNAYSIGYVPLANALVTAPNLQVADVNSRSPIANFGNKLVLVAISVVTNQVINSANYANGTPQLSPISGATGSCIKLVNPSRYALANNNAGNINPAGNYPIMAISYLLGNTSGNGADLTNTQALLNAPYNTAIQSNVTTIGGETGFQFLNVSSVFSATAPGACLAN